MSAFRGVGLALHARRRQPRGDPLGLLALGLEVEVHLAHRAQPHLLELLREVEVRGAELAKHLEQQLAPLLESVAIYGLLIAFLLLP